MSYFEIFLCFPRLSGFGSQVFNPFHTAKSGIDSSGLARRHYAALWGKISCPYVDALAGIYLAFRLNFQYFTCCNPGNTNGTPDNISGSFLSPWANIILPFAQSRPEGQP